ncbi:hypothetical protein PROFUN_06261 [Planoprotostelium fungivorum]|uniref:Rho-GAP domain-containing protein n=1 Tax=Planoprotostelium fungivorum TaxID=1890364 RepID=A0A2P6NE71_9EUKA|nr:hypothetical protein PROFUN_06261 [Planoprotostelium fungivorum]
MSRGNRTGTERPSGDGIEPSLQEAMNKPIPIEAYLERKYPQGANTKVKIIVTTKDRSYEYEASGASQAMQKRIGTFFKESRKNEKKKVSGESELPKADATTVTSNSTLREPARPRSPSTNMMSVSGASVVARSDDRRIFGRPLEAVMANVRKTKRNMIPKFLEDIIKHIILRGLNTEGIFRNSAEKVTIDSYKKLIDSGEPVIRAAHSSIIDLTVATGLIKTFLRELPEPIVTEDALPKFMVAGAIENQEERSIALQRLIGVLNEPNARVLQSVMCLMWNISQNEAINGMGVTALAAELGPVVFRYNPGYYPPNEMTREQQSAVYSATTTMIAKFHAIFSGLQARDLLAGGILWTGRRIIASQKSIHAMAPVKFTNSVSPHVITASITTLKIWDSQNIVPLYHIENGPSEQFGPIHSILVPKYNPPLSRGISRIVTSSSTKVDTSEVWVGSTKAIRVWSAQTQELKFSVEQEYSNMTFVRQMDGRHEIWAVKLQGDVIHRYDYQSYATIGTVNVPSGNLFVLFCATNGDVYGGTYNGCVLIWDTNGNLMKEIPGYHNWRITCFTETEDHVLSGGDDAIICQWDKQRRSFVSKIGPGVGKIRYLTYFDSLVWVCGWETFLKVYSKDFARHTATENYHVDSLSSLAFVNNKQRSQWQAWTGSYDGALCVWALAENSFVSTVNSSGTCENALLSSDCQSNASHKSINLKHFVMSALEWLRRWSLGVFRSRNTERLPISRYRLTSPQAYFQKGKMRATCFFLLLALGVHAAVQSDLVKYDSKGRLAYTKNSQGDRIMDYSSVGYRGGQALPDPSVIPTKVSVNPSGGDDTATIQGAIDRVAGFALDANGFRGAVYLRPGTYHISTLTLSTSGIILRGAGLDSARGTIVQTKSDVMPIQIYGSTSAQLGTKKYYLSKTYVPFGGNTLPMQSTAGLKIGDSVYIYSTITAKFIHLLGMDQMVRDGAAQRWIPAGQSVKTDRVIVAVTNNSITLDAGFPDSIRPELFDSDNDLPYVVTYTWDRLQNVGVENMIAIHPATTESNTDGFIDIDKAYNCWVRNLILQDYGTGVVTTQGDTKMITIQSLNIRYTYTDNDIAAPPQILSMLGTQILHRDSNITGGGKLWPMSSGGPSARGPTVHYNVNIVGGSGAQVVPHMRWSTGILYDNIVNPQGSVSISYRGIMGSGHGWTMGWGVIWNCEAATLCAQNPNNMYNSTDPVLYHDWLVGGKGTNSPGYQSTELIGTYDHVGTMVSPDSLYIAQLNDRR